MTLNLQLSKGMKALEIESCSDSEKTKDKLLKYLDLLQKWNKIHNLTAIRDPETMLTHHIIDSLSILPHISGSRIADIGTGAGLPGIPIAIIKSNWHVTLVESNKKKTAFLQQAKIELELNNIEIVSDRVEQYLTNAEYSTIVSRALSNLPNFIKLTSHLGNNKTKYVAMKANQIETEIEKIPSGYTVKEIIPLKVPGLNAERHLVIVQQT